MTHIPYDPDKALHGLMNIKESLEIPRKQFFSDAHAFICKHSPETDILCEIERVKREIELMIRKAEEEIMEPTQIK